MVVQINLPNVDSRTLNAKKVIWPFIELDLYCRLAQEANQVYTIISIGKYHLQFSGTREHNHSRSGGAQAAAMQPAW